MALVVAVEGMPGTGKTTVIRMMRDELQQSFKVAVADHETVGYAAAVRAAAKTHPFGHIARALYFLGLRIQQYEFMEELAEHADIVFLDHFWGNTLAYDVYGLPLETIERVRRYLKRQPDITLFFDAPLEVVQQRKETGTADYHAFARRIETTYKQLASEMPWIRVDAAAEPEQVKEYCLAIILARLEKP